jgi:phospholipase/carboxylesterase
MTKYILEVISVPTFSKKKPKKAIILCHGYGGDGQDIRVLAMNWQRFLPDVIFLCPNAPEVCSINSQGYQWFDLSSEKEDLILEKSLIAEDKLAKFLDQVLDSFQLNPIDLALVGFSQGSMIGIQVALKKKQKINSFIGYSGKIINKKHLSNNINSKPNIFLIHGANDTIVPPMHLLESKEYLSNHGLKTKIKLFNDCEHTISIQGSSLGLAFLKKNLL